MSSNHFMGTDGFIWFIGVVEDRDDPSELGRVRVRCVGFHTEDKTRIPTEGLLPYHVMHPVTDPSMSGMGHTPSFLVEGTWVVGFFRDAEEKQQPIIMGTLLDPCQKIWVIQIQVSMTPIVEMMTQVWL